MVFFFSWFFQEEVCTTYISHVFLLLFQELRGPLWTAEKGTQIGIIAWGSPTLQLPPTSINPKRFDSLHPDFGLKVFGIEIKNAFNEFLHWKSDHSSPLIGEREHTEISIYWVPPVHWRFVYNSPFILILPLSFPLYRWENRDQNSKACVLSPQHFSLSFFPPNYILFLLLLLLLITKVYRYRSWLMFSIKMIMFRVGKTDEQYLLQKNYGFLGFAIYYMCSNTYVFYK